MRVGDLVEVSNGVFNPLHVVTEPEKVAALADDMMRRGWYGPPLVVDGENAFTGAHRIASVALLWNTHGVHIPIAFVQIRDLCALYGVDWDELVVEWGYDTYAAATQLRFLLPDDVIEYLGYDVDGA